MRGEPMCWGEQDERPGQDPWVQPEACQSREDQGDDEAFGYWEGQSFVYGVVVTEGIAALGALLGLAGALAGRLRGAAGRIDDELGYDGGNLPRRAFGRFQRDITRKTFSDHHVDRTLADVVTFNKALVVHGLQVGLTQQLPGLADLQAGQFLQVLAKPDVDLVSGIPPTVAIDQRDGYSAASGVDSASGRTPESLVHTRVQVSSRTARTRKSPRSTARGQTAPS